MTENSSPESPPQNIEKIAEELPPLNEEDKMLAQQKEEMGKELLTPAEDKEFTALRNHIMDAGFVAAGVAFHIRYLCSEPMTTPSTTTWDFKDRAVIPEMVFTLLRQPGYLEGIWPSLKVVMGSNIRNDIWCAGIATTIAFFDVIRTLPALKELRNDS